MAKELYPLLFEPVAEPAAWADDLLADFLNDAAVASAESGIGIYWQLADSSEGGSQVANGPLQGTPLTDLRRHMPHELIGRRHVSTDPFPLCVRILNVGRDQALGVHPEAQNAAIADIPSNAKFWYCLSRRPGGCIVAGIAPRITGQQLFSKLDQPDVADLLQHFPSRVGDSYLVMPGIVHGIGAGNLVLEIQQRNEPPLRLAGMDGGEAVPDTERDVAMASVQLVTRQTPRISRETSNVGHTRRIPLTPNCPHFLVDEIRLVDHISLRTFDDSFDVLIVVRGTARIEGRDWGEMRLATGALCCVPASFGKYKLCADGGAAEVLRVRRPFIP